MCIVSDFFFFKQKTAYEMRISDWSSDVCSSDLDIENKRRPDLAASSDPDDASVSRSSIVRCQRFSRLDLNFCPAPHRALNIVSPYRLAIRPFWDEPMRSEEHTSALQSLMRSSYSVFCLKKKTITQSQPHIISRHHEDI